jgi:hypothetical protein
MAYSRVPFTYTSGPQVFPTSFALGVLEADHIRVTVDGVVDGLGDPVEYAFTYNATTGDVTVLDTLTSGQTGVIQRSVPLDELVADFEAGDDVSKRNLVRATKQTLMAVQEAADGREADNILITETVETINDIAASIEDNVAQTTADRIAAEAAADTAVPAAATATAQAAIATTQAGLATAANTAAQSAKTAAETAATNADADAAQTALDRIAVAADRATTVAARDTAVTAASAASADADDASDSAAAAATSESNAATSETNAAASAAAAAAFVPTLASQAEAEAGTDNTKLMTPLRTRQASPISKRFESANQVITAAGLLTIPHGLGAVPDVVTVVLECVTAEYGYSVGDLVLLSPSERATGFNLSIRVTPTNLVVRFASSATALIVIHATTGAGVALTNANWRIRFKALA